MSFPIQNLMKIRQGILELLHEDGVCGGANCVCFCVVALRWKRSACFKAQCYGGEQVTIG